MKHEPKRGPRPMTPQEEAFIQGLVEDRGDMVATKEGTHFTLSPLERKRPKRTWFWQRLNFWVGTLLVLPFLLTGVFLALVFRFEVVLGKENLQYLSQQQLTPELESAMKAYGFEWVPMALDIYVYRGAIIAGIFALFLLLASLVYGCGIYFRARRGGPTQELSPLGEEPSEEEGSHGTP